MENQYRRRAAEIRRSIATAATQERADRLREVAHLYEISAAEIDRPRNVSEPPERRSQRPVGKRG
jgi:hypothetical protein